MIKLYSLKPNVPAFQVTREGAFEYHTFKHGEIYREIPEEEAHKFDLQEIEEGGKEE